MTDLVGAIVSPRDEWKQRNTDGSPVDYGYGIVMDQYDDDFGTTYCHVFWPNADSAWWEPHELILISKP
tara:strand:+ start:8010 stop:8216 length:207 start_codon:yes stop_codon:yes gene_type:complete